MKSIWLSLFILAAIATITLSAAQAQDEPFRVAAVAPSASNDLAFSQSLYDALMTLQDEMGEEQFAFEFMESTYIVDDAAVALRDWAISGEFQLIIAHGSQYGTILEDLAPEFPEISFAWGTDTNTFGQDNIYSYTVAAEEGGYINGAIAASLSETGVIGVVGSVAVGDGKWYVDGFVAGAAEANPDVTVNVVYIQSFSDVPQATEAALAHIANGADALTGTAQMVVGPIAVAIEHGALWYGNEVDQSELAADSGMLFQVYHWDVVLAEMIANIQEGVLGGEILPINLANGGITMELSEHSFGGDEARQARVRALVDEHIEQLALMKDDSAGETEDADSEDETGGEDSGDDS